MIILLIICDTLTMVSLETYSVFISQLIDRSRISAANCSMFIKLTGHVSSMEQRQSRILFSRPWLSLSREKIVLDWRQLEKALIMLEY